MSDKRQEEMKTKGSFLKGLIGIITSIAAVLIFGSAVLEIFNFLSPNQEKSKLQAQIAEVESAIDNLQSIENNLKKIKDDMIATKQAKDRIEEEYDKAKELKKLTDRQIEAISLAVNKRTKKDALMDYLRGFILGVAGSLVANSIIGLIKRKRVSS